MLPVLPMGTIMAVCMLVGVLFATRLPPFNVAQKIPLFFKWLIAVIVFAAGCWNVFWYAVRHIDEFWGQAALVSGLLMMFTSYYIADLERLPGWLKVIRPVVVLALFGSALLYGITIVRL